MMVKNLFIVKENGVSRNKLRMIQAARSAGNDVVFFSAILVND